MDNRDAAVTGVRRRSQPHRLAIEDDLSRRGRDDAGKDLHQCRLAGAVLAEKRRHLPAVDVEVHALQRMDRAVGLGDVTRGEHHFAHVGVSGRRVAHWTVISTGVTSQFFGLTRVKAPTTETVLPWRPAVSIAAEHFGLHGVVDGGAGVLVLDLVLEVAELDLAGGVAQVGAVDRRAGLHPDLRLAGEAVDGDVVDAGLALADDAGELDREHRADTGGDAVLAWSRRPCRRRRPATGLRRRRRGSGCSPSRAGKVSAPNASGEKPAAVTSCSEPMRTTVVSNAMPTTTAKAAAATSSRLRFDRAGAGSAMSVLVLIRRPPR